MLFTYIVGLYVSKKRQHDWTDRRAQFFVASYKMIMIGQKCRFNFYFWNSSMLTEKSAVLLVTLECSSGNAWSAKLSLRLLGRLEIIVICCSYKLRSVAPTMGNIQTGIYKILLHCRVENLIIKGTVGVILSEKNAMVDKGCS